jgi:hypothetical protein
MIDAEFGTASSLAGSAALFVTLAIDHQIVPLGIRALTFKIVPMAKLRVY